MDALQGDGRVQKERGDEMSYIVPRDKPNRCTNCQFMDRITYDCMLMYENYYSDFESQYEHCPLVEIPISHGRLGDLNALQEQIKLTVQDAHMSALWKQGMVYAHGLVEASKTIIEAERENI